jgi:hypothetical protein
MLIDGMAWLLDEDFLFGQGKKKMRDGTGGVTLRLCSTVAFDGWQG